MESTTIIIIIFLLLLSFRHKMKRILYHTRPLSAQELPHRRARVIYGYNIIYECAIVIGNKMMYNIGFGTIYVCSAVHSAHTQTEIK